MIGNNVKSTPNNQVSNLAKQFNKPLQIKNNTNLIPKQVQNISINNNSSFTKKNNVHFQNSPSRQQSQNQYEKISSNYNFTQKYQTQFSQYDNKSNGSAVLNQSIKNSNQKVNKSFETPKFNYQSPSFNVDMKNSYSSNHMQNSLQSNPGILSSFNAYNAPKI